MRRLLGLQGVKATRISIAVTPSEDWAVATTLESRGLLRRGPEGFYATVKGLDAVENMMGSLTFSPIG